MNRVYISGMIAGTPEFRMEKEEIPHLTFVLSMRRGLENGRVCREFYRISACKGIARWGAEHLKKGQIVGIQGSLTQRRVLAANVTAVETVIVADEFLAGPSVQERSEAGVEEDAL